MGQRSLIGVVGVLGVFAALTEACGCPGSSEPTAEPDAAVVVVPDSATPDTSTPIDSSVAVDSGPPTPSAGGTGAFAVVNVNGKQKLYLPLGDVGTQAIVAVVDADATGKGTAGAPALITNVVLPTPVQAADVVTATGGDSTIVVAVSTENRNIHFIDPKTDKLVKTIQLPATFGRSDFSGGGGYVTGVAIDTAKHRAFLGVYDGFQIVDLTTMTLGAHIQAAPSENFGFDAQRGYLIAPFYGCHLSHDAAGAELTFCDDYKNTLAGDEIITDGVNVIDLSDNSVLTFVMGGVPFPGSPLGGEPDSAGSDPSTGLAVIPSEGNRRSNVLDLSKAVFDKAAKTFTAPLTVFDPLEHDCVAVAGASSHYAFWLREVTSTIAVTDLSTLASGRQPVSALMPNVPGDVPFVGYTDPHGIAASVGIADGKPRGFLAHDDRRWVARVDLKGLFAASPDAASLDEAATAPFVTYLDARTKP